jgi:hypothetical protein
MGCGKSDLWLVTPTTKIEQLCHVGHLADVNPAFCGSFRGGGHPVKRVLDCLPQ